MKIWYERKAKILFSIVNILISRKVSNFRSYSSNNLTKTVVKNYEKAIDLLIQVADIPQTDQCATWSIIGKLFVQVEN